MNQREFWSKALLLTIVILPIVALVFAIIQLWNGWVHGTDLALLLGLYGLTTLGVAMGFHRMLTHKSFEAPAPVRFVMLALGSMALEGPAVDWAATHTKHHAKADREGDPHSPLEGFWHAHLGWLFTRGLKPESIYYRNFEGDRVAHVVSKLFPLWAFLTFAIPFGIGFLAAGWLGAWSGLLWGGLVRIFFNHHITWSVNSICHTFGAQPYQTPDRSKNEWVIGVLALGEGWHNNHHAFPRSAIHGLRWYQFDLSGYIIRLLAWMRVLREVYVMRKGQLVRLFAKPAPASKAA